MCVEYLDHCPNMGNISRMFGENLCRIFVGKRTLLEKKKRLMSSATLPDISSMNSYDVVFCLLPDAKVKHRLVDNCNFFFHSRLI